MLKFLPYLVVFSGSLFFSISTIVGYTYQGKESSPIYIVYNVGIFIISLGMFFFDSVLTNKKFSKNQLLILSVPFILTFFYLVEMFFSNIPALGNLRYLYFILYGLPGVLIGVYLSKNNRFISSIKYMDILMVIFSIATILFTLESLKTGTGVDIGGASYQGASYIAAFAFGINIYNIYYGKNHLRYKFTNIKLYKILSYVLLPLQLIGVLSSGGRGGLILIVGYILYISGSIILNKNIKLTFKYFLSLSSFLILFFSFFSLIKNIPIFERSFNRVFSYFSNGSLDWSGTSGRDIVYTDAIELIMEAPLFGYGIFGMWQVIDYYPHNILLEILLQGGIFYLLLAIIFAVILYKKLLLLLQKEKQMRIIIIIILYPLIMLLFSGTYIDNTIFWFAISLIISSSYKKVI